MGSLLTYLIFACVSLSIRGATDECATITESVFMEGSDGWTGSFGSISVQNGCAKILPSPNCTNRSSHFIAPVHFILFNFISVFCLTLVFVQSKFVKAAMHGCKFEIELKHSSGFDGECSLNILLAEKISSVNLRPSSVVGTKLNIDPNQRTYSLDFSHDVLWEHAETGFPASRHELGNVLRNLGAILIRGCNSSVSLCAVRSKPSRSVDTQEDCDAVYADRRWHKALECYQNLRSQGNHTCLVLMRVARLQLLIQKPDVNSTLQLLNEAVSTAQLDPGEIECGAWAERTAGDVYYRLKEYRMAANLYEKALASSSIVRELSAVIRSDYASAMYMLGDYAGATRHYQTAIQEFPDLMAHHILGTMGTTQYQDDARVVIESALKRNHKAISKIPLSPWHKQLHTFNTTQRGRLFSVRGMDAFQNGARPGGCACSGVQVLSIALFCRLRGQTPGTADQVWGPSSIEKGVGGSEEAAIYLSRQLAKLGHCVTVYGNPAPEEWGADEYGVIWLPFFAFRSDIYVDAFVSWRNFDAVWLGRSALFRYIWVHDPLALASDQDYFVQPFLDAVKGIFVLSKHSASQFPPSVQDKLILTSNGLAPHLVLDGPNDHCKLLYSSWPSSGLELILEVWPEIVSKVPCAELNVYYGFDMWWATPIYKHERWFIDWRKRMESLLRQKGVRYHGMVGHSHMAEAYAENGFYLYPTDTPETAPINLMKAQANGCIPITSRLPSSAIPETCGQFDLGPTPPDRVNAGKIHGDAAWTAAWTASVVEAVQLDHGSLRNHRLEMKAYSRQRFNWTRVAMDWHNVFNKALE